MYVLVFVAAAWLAAAVGITTAFLGAKHSRIIYTCLFGHPPSAAVYPFAIAANDSSEPVHVQRRAA
jgi:hypothetical protein